MNYLINCVEKILVGQATEMFGNQEVFVIHKKNQLCTASSPPSSSSSSSSPSFSLLESDINEFLTYAYPKNKKLSLIFNILVKQNLINHDLFFKSFPNIHIADFCSFINNRFGEKNKNNSVMVKFCKYLNSLGVKLPKIAIKNPVAIKILS